jgi:hypothetical protein
VQVVGNSAASNEGHTGPLYSKYSGPAAGAGMALFPTALDIYSGVLWGGELQGFVIHGMMPALVLPRALWSRGGSEVRRTALWARPHPGALDGALVMPRKPWSGPVLPPPKFPGVAMESCLQCGLGGVGVGALKAQQESPVVP